MSGDLIKTSPPHVVNIEITCLKRLFISSEQFQGCFAPAVGGLDVISKTHN